MSVTNLFPCSNKFTFHHPTLWCWSWTCKHFSFGSWYPQLCQEWTEEGMWEEGGSLLVSKVLPFLLLLWHSCQGCSWTLWWLIFSVKLAGPQGAYIFCQHYSGCFCQCFWARLTLKSVNSEWSRMPSMWMSLIWSIFYMGMNNLKQPEN